MDDRRTREDDHRTNRLSLQPLQIAMRSEIPAPEMGGTPAETDWYIGVTAVRFPPARESAMPRLVHAALLLLLASLFFSATASAQVLRVTVSDLSGAPVEDAMVRLEAPDGTLVRATFSGGGGRAGLRAPATGAYNVRVQRAGYEAQVVPVQVAAGETPLRVQLRARPLALDTVTVIAPGEEERGRDAFRRRSAMENGVFLDPEYFATRYRGSRWTADLLREAPGIEIHRVPQTGRPYVRNGRQWHCFTVLIDGQRYRGPGPMDNWYRPSDIVGVEIYHISSDIPREYRQFTWEDTTRFDAKPCGLILYWTRRGW